jgi:hypothetical protein
MLVIGDDAMTLARSEKPDLALRAHALATGERASLTRPVAAQVLVEKPRRGSAAHVAP